jgi:peptidyl-prolyl cis-trans isomerase B (cyclophilin B)
MPWSGRVLSGVALACLALVAGCGDDGEQPAATSTPEDTGGEQGSGCARATRPEPKHVDLDKPKERLDKAATYVATVKTSCGTFEITLDAKRAPRTGGSFKHLADEGVFDGTTFHRVEPGFVIQGGDPAGNGTGGPGYSIVEPPPGDLTYDKGVVAMAKAETEPPGTSGSQFFVVTGEDGGLPPQYALLGIVLDGLDVVDAIGALPLDSADPQGARPVDPVVIDSIEIEGR